MGQLEDAIREHLALKRERGSSPQEVSRLESEAFGGATARSAPPATEQAASAPVDVPPEPPPRAPEPPPPAEDPVAAEDHVAAEHPVRPSEPDADRPTSEFEPFDLDEVLDDEPSPPLPPTPVDESPLPPPVEDPSPPEQPGPVEPPAPPSPEQPPAPIDDPSPGVDPGPDPPTIQVEEGEHDVLEETPEFLKDTDQDRLWFEQTPPKDFDFDE